MIEDPVPLFKTLMWLAHENVIIIPGYDIKPVFIRSQVKKQLIRIISVFYQVIECQPLKIMIHMNNCIQRIIKLLTLISFSKLSNVPQSFYLVLCVFAM